MVSEFIREAKRLADQHVSNNGMPGPGETLFVVSRDERVFFLTYRMPDPDKLSEVSEVANAVMSERKQRAAGLEMVEKGMREKASETMEHGLLALFVAMLSAPGGRDAYEDILRDKLLPLFAVRLGGGEAEIALGALVDDRALQ